MQPSRPGEVCDLHLRVRLNAELPSDDAGRVFDLTTTSGSRFLIKLYPVGQRAREAAINA